jgi:hypothetical protein
MMLNDFEGPLALLAQIEASEAGRSVGPVVGWIVAALLIWITGKIVKGDSLAEDGR